MAKHSAIRLKPGASIGEPAAEDDHRFLADAFVDHPAIEALKDFSSPRNVLLGRTGSGKSAILWHIENTADNVTRLDPRDIAFEYIGTSPIIRQIRELDVDLHVLYEYLWTHILTLHVIRECLNVRNEDGLRTIISAIKSSLWRDRKREIAINYLNEHAGNFFLTIEQVFSEFTGTISNKLSAEAGVSPEFFKLQIERGHQWLDEQKRLFRHRAQEVVSSLQMRELKETINALAECMHRKPMHYILIDDLDREWAGGELVQYALIRALLESLKTLRRIPNLKIIVAIREDLYEATLRTTTDKHFQVEKLEGVITRLRWSDDLLSAVVDRRIRALFRHAYTSKVVRLENVLPQSVNQKPLRPYLISHTLRRPRDIIAFVNKILAENANQVLPLPARAVTKAELGHSNARLRALEDEWRSCHPLIGTYISALRQLSGSKSIDVLDEERLFPLLVEVDGLDRKPVDDVERIAATVYERDKGMRLKALARALLVCLYKVGAVGVKIHATQRFMFCYEEHASLTEMQIGEETRFVVQPMLASSLGCQPAQADAA